jgi:DNA-directed RNA polymerase specialized sigma24 family protein
VLNLFKRIRNERSDVETLQLRIKELQLSLLPSGIRYDTDKVQTSPSDKMIEVAAKVDALERQMQKKLTALNADMVQAIAIVQAMPTPEYRQLLTLRYLTGNRMSWEQIADVMGYSTDHVRGYLHKSAINEAREVNTH